ncbi:Ribose-5-phosphate isomerase A [Thalassoglobus neptunius]|uniref:Ribose-5-phosphate isomerase A n=1 Tax=Thalassoglobus neptunius TaxID=1938619 RepID=A0A5C5VP80_9PLAN|nr:ribose-5-phosphate isomerase RpiA [Thalassoglobus neptunius]TWT39813.1 Ribose-5-phosphate isomerase A [Thalassoglobus neptunius]
MTSSASNEKQLAAAAAVSMIHDGMVIGLGSGSTSAIAIELIGERVRSGLQIVGVPTSAASEQLAKRASIPLTTLDESPEIDITIDGADRFNDDLDLIKGGGGALLREKIVAAASKQLIIITDSQKRSNPLQGFPVPVEVVPFGLKPLMNRFAALQLSPRLRMRSDDHSKPFVTDEKNFIVDLQVSQIAAPHELQSLLTFPGIVEHGLFLEMASFVLMGEGTEVQRFDRR